MIQVSHVHASLPAVPLSAIMFRVNGLAIWKGPLSRLSSGMKIIAQSSKLPTPSETTVEARLNPTVRSAKRNNIVCTQSFC